MALEQAWQSSEHCATEVLQQRFAEAIARCQQTIDEQVAISRAAALAEQQTAATQTKLQAHTEQVVALAQSLYELAALVPEQQAELEQHPTTLSKRKHSSQRNHLAVLP